MKIKFITTCCTVSE